jgi:TldD protein
VSRAVGPDAGLLDVLTVTMERAVGRCSYGDARRVVTGCEHVATRNGRVERIDLDEADGIGVRVRVGGAWGFAATSDPSAPAAERALERALDFAAEQPRTPERPLAPAPPARGAWLGPCERDPFGIGAEEKLDLLLAAEAGLAGDPRIVHTQARCLSVRTAKGFASTEGAACTQTVVESGASIAAVAVDGSELQQRSYPGQHDGGVAAAGWEHVESLELAAHAPRVAEEALGLLDAPPCPSGVTTVVLDAEQLALQLHESIGHALELDRMLGAEASYAGTSWVSPADLGRLRYGSERVNVTADATLPGGLGSFGWDDEGIAARSLELIRDGRLLAALSSRESAAAIGLDASGGCARADGHARQPIVRMTNVSLEPGDAGSLEDLVADTDEGLYLETNRSWSIDDRRLQFQFATEVGREIRGGQLGRLYRNPSYAGVTPRFWASLDAVCSPAEWRLWGLVNCGKGEPGQVAHVSHGTAPARFRGVQVGVA